MRSLRPAKSGNGRTGHHLRAKGFDPDVPATCRKGVDSTGKWSGRITQKERKALERLAWKQRCVANGVKSQQEIRILYLKKRHEIVKLKRKFPEIDFDTQDKKAAIRRKWAGRGKRR